MFNAVIITYVISIAVTLLLHYATERIRKIHYKKYGIAYSYSYALLFSCFVPLLNLTIHWSGYEDMKAESIEVDEAETIRNLYLK